MQHELALNDPHPSSGRFVSHLTRSTFGLILAGGEGRRWGGPKALARLPDGRTFLEACREMLAEFRRRLHLG